MGPPPTSARQGAAVGRPWVPRTSMMGLAGIVMPAGAVLHSPPVQAGLHAIGAATQLAWEVRLYCGKEQGILR